MRALTLWQPWATAIACGAKKIETRSWGTPYRGPIAIHAAKKWNWDLGITALHCQRVYGLPAEIPRGCFVAVAGLVDCRRMTDEWIAEQTEQELDLGGWEVGRFGWVFANRRPIPPVPYKGAQGLWSLPESTRVVLEALAAAS